MEPGMSAQKQRILELARTHVIPGRVSMLEQLGIDLVIGRREGYRIWDLDGRELLDLHLNGGTFNLGHRNPELLRVLAEALERLDIGNHHFPSVERAELAAKLCSLSPGGRLRYTVFASGGSEANDVAIKTARRATGRRTVVALDKGYHGRTGLSGAAGDDDAARYFLSDAPADFLKVPFDDLDAVETALRAGGVAAVLIEPLPATYGFPVPSDGYLPGLRRLCDEHGALLIADEVQTGLGRTGKLWAVECWDVVPDILVTGKGLSGGIYPIAATLVSEAAGAWLTENAWGHVSTFGGAEPGCVVASAVLDVCSNPDTLAHAEAMSSRMYAGLEALRQRHPFLAEVRRKGLVMGLRFDHAAGALLMAKALYDNGVWAMFSGFDLSVLQWKPGLLIDEVYCDSALERLEAAVESVESSEAIAGGLGSG